jgi:hypothetical protein
MATVQGPRGQIEIFEDFVGAEVPVALTNAFGNIGSLRVIGDGLAETDSGIVSLDCRRSKWCCTVHYHKRRQACSRCNYRCYV